MKNQFQKIILNNMKIFNIMKKSFNITINTIEFMIHKYYNKAVKYIKQIINKKILTDISIKNIDYHNRKF